ncbi:glycoside hydrolase family 16 protein [Collybiopsis luxurians FD-317 M1]|nr:glycoside hydrolase family 16 protein [Collybiopsis luxurians FD-317 M1]
MILSFLTSLLFPLVVQAAFYTQTECYVGHDFVSPEKFTFFSDADPTHGRVNYVNATTANYDNLTFTSEDIFIARADYTTVLDPNGPGRNSVRIISNQYYTTSVIVIDLQHMPQGCACSQPAIWTLGADWPNNGEVDIVEGVNSQASNQATLHTSANCTMPETYRPQTGTSISDNCDVNANFNQGCGVAFKNGTFGPSFNERGGGWFAMERTVEYIKVWSWSRDDFTVPLSVRYGSPVLDTDLWGLPVAYFPNTSCDLAAKFGPHQIIINRGDWAGQDAVYAASGCPGSCIDHVNNDPESFKEAYFEFNSITVYEPRRSSIFPRAHHLKRAH